MNQNILKGCILAGLRSKKKDQEKSTILPQKHDDTFEGAKQKKKNNISTTVNCNVNKH